MSSGQDDSTHRLDDSSETEYETSVPVSHPRPSTHTTPHESKPSGISQSWETLDSSGNLQPGQIAFTRYLVDSLLGKGGMGSVWLVRHLELDQQRALKLIVAGLATDSQARTRFQREAKILARISEHRHAVTVHDARLTSSEVAYIDMEYVQGQSLDKICKKGKPMPLEWVDRILGQLCDVLQFAHDNQIIHRDLKPSNLMLVEGRPEGQEHLKVLDFGIGKIMGAPEVEGEARTMTGAFMGTPPYTSPEQAAGEAEPASDFYSVGVILYEFLTGHRPFNGSPVRMIADSMTATPPSFRDINPDVKVPPEVERVVLRCMAKSPDDRPKSAREIASDFHKAVVASQTANREYSDSDSSSARSGKRGWSKIAGWLVAAVILITAVAWYANRDVEKQGGSQGPWEGGRPGTGDLSAAEKKTESGNAGPSVKTPVTVEPMPVVLVFDPKDALVTVNGKPRTLDAEGRLELDRFELPASVAAKSEGRVPIDRAVTLAEVGLSPLRIELTATPVITKLEVAARVESFLNTSCRRCHGVDFQGNPFDVLDRSTLVASNGPALIKPGDPDASGIFLAASREHPAEKAAPASSKADLELLRSWIEEGAEFPPPPPRSRRTDQADLAAIAADLRTAKESDRPFLRYFTLASLSNRPISERTLRLARAAVAKALNSLSWSAEVAVPRAVDPDGLILAVDVRAIGWDAERLWDTKLMPQYPYGLTHDGGVGSTRELEREVETLSKSKLPIARADWFVATATRPPLYHGLLGIPRTISELEAKLDVDKKADFRDASLLRTASAKNRHALHPRIIDYHAPFTRAFWRTYDLRREDGPKGLFAAPLGPEFQGHPFPEVAFKPDAEAILFGLPNGLQGYMLADGNGDRIEVAPDDLLSDPLRSAGTTSVVTGISCIACHRVGVKRFDDMLSARVAVLGQAKVKLRELSPGAGELEQLLAGHEKRFLTSLDRAAGSFLRVGEDAKVTIDQFPEPINPISRLYQADLSADDIAAELGVDGGEAFTNRLTDLDPDGKFGLAPLANHGRITRQAWTEAFVVVAQGLKLGTEKKVFGNKPD